MQAPPSPDSGGNAVDAWFNAAQTLLSMAPIPGIAATVVAVQQIYYYVQRVNARKEECAQLAMYSASITQAVLENYHADRMSAFTNSVIGLKATVEEVTADLKVWSSAGKAAAYLRSNDMAKALARHRQNLSRSLEVLGLAQVLDQQEWNRRFEQSQQDDHILLERIAQSQEDLLKRVTDLQNQMKNWVPYSKTDPDGRQLARAKDEIYELRSGSQSESYVLPPRELEGEVQKIGTRPAHAGSMYDIWRGVWLGEYNVALKVFRGTNPREKDLERINRQVDLWRTLKHAHILPLFGICRIDGGSNPPIYFVSPWLKHKDAMSYIRNTPTVDRLRILHDVLRGLQYLHSLDILHGGLQGSNVLISRKGRARLSDFSLSKVMDGGAMFTQSNGPSASLRWMSPEAHNAEVMTAQSDVYSFGMTALQILSGQIPFYKIKAMGQLVVSIAVKHIKPQREDYPSEYISDKLWVMLNACWAHEPEQRPDVEKLMEALTEVRKEQYNWDGLDPADDDEMDNEYPQSF